MYVDLPHLSTEISETIDQCIYAQPYNAPRACPISAQVGECEGFGKRTGIPDFEAVGEEHYLDAAVAVVEMGGRETGVVFPAVVISKDSKIEIAVLDFIEVNRIGPTVGSWDIALEQKAFKEAPQERVASEVGG